MQAQQKAITLTILVSLYFAQGLPSGLFVHALPALLRSYGVSLETIGLLKLLAMPWVLKCLWAPVIDQTWTRRRWILLLQSMVIPLLWLIGYFEPTALVSEDFLWLVAVLLFINMLSASQDIATDGLAVQSLPGSWLGLANSIQAAAYKVGLLMGGTALLIFIDRIGWQSSFQLLSMLVAVALLPLLLLKMPQERATRSNPGFVHIWTAFTSYVRQPDMPRWMVIVVGYKIADELGSTMLKPLLIDMHYSLTDVGIFTSVASAFGLLGAGIGGLLFLRFESRVLLLLLGVVQVLAIVSFASLPWLAPSDALVHTVISVEQFVDGLSTVTLFAMMMRRCRQGLEGTDYTIQNSLHLAGVGVASLISGFMAATLGYGVHFVVAGLIGLVALLPIVGWKVSEGNGLRK